MQSSAASAVVRICRPVTFGSGKRERRCGVERPDVREGLLDTTFFIDLLRGDTGAVGVGARLRMERSGRSIPP